MSVTNGTRRGRRRRWAAIVALGLLAPTLVIGACGGDEDAADDQGGSVAAQIAQGKDLYQANCASCHGTDLRGTSQGPSHLSIVYEPGHHGDDAFRSAVANGAPAHHWKFGDMPPVPSLSSDQVDAIIAYVRQVQQRVGFEQ